MNTQRFFVSFLTVAGFLAFFVALNAYAQQPRFRPSCGILNNGPVTTKNGTATLSYDVNEFPTTVTISPTVSGMPQLTQPDPNRVDGRQTGYIETKGITKTTTFEMTVRNSKGSSKCSTTVYYRPMPSGGWDVPLVSQEPIFTRFDIPSGYNSNASYSPFYGSIWIQGGYFVVSGYGNSSVGGTAPNRHESGGMYAFNENGSFLGARDVIYDTSGLRTACHEGGGCSAGFPMHPTGTGRLVRDMQPGFGHIRSAVQYSISSSGINLLNRLFFNRDSVNYPNELAETVPNGPQQFQNIAIADGKMFGVGARHTGLFDRNGEYALEIYDLNFNYLGKYSKPWVRPPGSVSGAPPRSVQIWTPLAGIGKFILSLEGFTELRVYRAPSLDDIQNGREPELIQTIPYPDSYAFDSANQNRIGFLYGQGRGRDVTLDVYEAGENELTKVASRKFDDVFATMTHQTPHSGFAFSGDYVAYASCGDTDYDGHYGGSNYDSCEIVVAKISDGKKMNVEPLPRDPEFEWEHSISGSSQLPLTFAISPSGKILVATLAGASNGNIYLYQIGGVTVQPPITPGPGNFNINLSEQDLLDLLALYLRVLGVAHGQIFGGNQTGNTGGATGGNTGSTGGNTGGNTGNTGSTGGTAGGSGDKDPLLDYGD